MRGLNPRESLAVTRVRVLVTLLFIGFNSFRFGVENIMLMTILR